MVEGEDRDRERGPKGVCPGGTEQEPAADALRRHPEPKSLRRVLGPSMIMAALAIGSGEYLLWPYITTQVGLVLLWAAIVGSACSSS